MNELPFAVNELQEQLAGLTVKRFYNSSSPLQIRSVRFIVLGIVIHGKSIRWGCDGSVWIAGLGPVGMSIWSAEAEKVIFMQSS
jgi:hypothetical protein